MLKIEPSVQFMLCNTVVPAY